MKCKTPRMLFLLISLFMLIATGCGKYEQVRVSDVKIESLNMNGFRSVDVALSVVVDNPAGKIVIKEAEGVVKQSGKIIGKVTLAPLTLRARTVAEYKAEAGLALADGIRFQQALALLDMRRLGECTVDVVFKGTAGGIKVKKKLNDIPLKKLLEGNNYEKI